MWLRIQKQSQLSSLSFIHFDARSLQANLQKWKRTQIVVSAIWHQRYIWNTGRTRYNKWPWFNQLQCLLHYYKRKPKWWWCCNIRTEGTITLTSWIQINGSWKHCLMYYCLTSHTNHTNVIINCMCRTPGSNLDIFLKMFNVFYVM